MRDSAEEGRATAEEGRAGGGSRETRGRREGGAGVAVAEASEADKAVEVVAAAGRMEVLPREGMKDEVMLMVGEMHRRRWAQEWALA
jgi:hypothetical protein